MKWYHALIIGMQFASLVTTIEGGLVGWGIILLIVLLTAILAYQMNEGMNRAAGEE